MFGVQTGITTASREGEGDKKGGIVQEEDKKEKERDRERKKRK
jgi:hypothetical protein